VRYEERSQGFHGSGIQQLAHCRLQQILTAERHAQLADLRCVNLMFRAGVGSGNRDITARQPGGDFGYFLLRDVAVVAIVRLPGDAVCLQQDAHRPGDIRRVNFFPALRRDAIRLTLRNALDQVVPLAAGRHVVQAVDARRAQSANVIVVPVAVTVNELFDGGFVGPVVTPGPRYPNLSRFTGWKSTPVQTDT